MSLSKEKIYLITPIFSEGALGGAEKLAWEYANLLKEEFHITVVTTTSKDYRTWKEFYKPGIEIVNGIEIHRFPVEKKRSYYFNRFHKKIISKKGRISDKEFYKWIEMQGPVSSGIAKYVEEKKDSASVFFFITYLYYTTVVPIQFVKNKSICALTLHDEPPAYFPQFKNIYSSEIAYCFSTIEEWKTYETVFHSSPETYSIIGVNVDIPEVKTTQTHPNPYIVYIGRIDGGKGIEQLLEYYSYWKTLAQEVPDLVLLGGGKPPDLIPNGVHFKGFVTLEEKVSYLSNSLFLVNPSPMESFSIVLMEAWLLNKPVLVNGNCDTMKNHCLRSNGGLFFKDSESFAATANFLLQNPNIREKMSVNGNQYVKMNFSKEMIKSKLLNLIKRRIAKY